MLVALGLLTACGGEPRVSPWGEHGAVQLSLYAEKPDVEARLRAIDAETLAAGLTLTREADARSSDGTRYIVRAYAGVDRLGRKTHATRVASPFSVVLAIGPPAEKDGDRVATELSPPLDAGGGRVVTTPADLDGDGSPEVLLRSRAGTLEVFTLAPRGARTIAVELRGPPSGVEDVGGRAIALSTTLQPDFAPPLLPRFIDVATLVDERYTNTSKEARAFHVRARDRATAAQEGEPNEARLTRRLVWGFHALCAGDDRDDVVAALKREPVDAALKSAYLDLVRYVEARTRSATP